MKRLEGKVALITGGARGQGAAEARLFVAEGARVVIADILDEQGQQLAEELGEAALYQRLDVTRPEDWAAAVATTQECFGKLDVLVNNAGVLICGTIESLPLDTFRQVIEINQVGCWLGMKAVLPAMKEAGGGSIINLSSAAGMEGVAGNSAYCASKFAVRGMTKVAAIEFGRFNIRVNSVHPGGVDTDMVKNPAFSEEEAAATYRGLPISRVGQPEEVAELVLFLASDKSSYSTGSEFVIDGGLLAGKDYS